MITKFLTLFLLVLACRNNTSTVAPQPVSDAIQVNQIGYYPTGPKRAVVKTTAITEFQIIDAESQRMVFSGDLSDVKDWPLAGTQAKIADFTDFQQVGTYRINIPDLGTSYPFAIRANNYHEALRTSMKSFYYQRTGMPITEQYGGRWQRPAAHPDQEVIFHPSSGRSGSYASTGGWYDAGDFGKYIVNGAFSVGQMLFLQEQYPNVLPDNSLNIPESGNGTSDFLDELRYQMDWMLTMQDTDGGLFFKLTSKKFTGMKMPHEVSVDRYIIGKSTTATLDFAACAAKMSRAYAHIDSAYAKTCRTAAERAWNWAVAHPDVPFKNPEDVKTGEYGDSDMRDEFFWAAAELYATSQDEQYLDYLQELPKPFRFKEGESWNAFQLHLGVFTLLQHAPRLPFSQQLRGILLTEADQLVDFIAQNDYRQPLDDFHWGSNSDVLNAAMILAQAYRQESKPAYLAAIQESVDYIFGKNPLSMCYVTGLGSNSPMNIHHRQSAADGIDEPVPGFISGGPNSRQQDKAQVDYPANAAPMKSWVDVTSSYASNEVCLNWNAPLEYVLGFLEGEMSK